MNKIGRKLYYDKTTGDIIVDTGERSGNVVGTTSEKDISTYITLSERNIETFDFIQLEFGQYSQDFAECNGYMVNPETRLIEFSYPDPNEPDIEPVYQKPLSVEVANLRELVDTMLGVE